ncbi:restriction endonuclease subunit S [Rubrivivax gelatinosus]|uniref:restriction endonuclease subunit S n=1 Tax=Rubrivivax gelatinosus TaxID=28068 RepID=UPI0006821261|nr:restriction endonuclease subunit S [Rubrivivax gelatinosus]MBG6081120.1 type I restriction enzyme S subunit [Rubrivivax gelatinosus]
MKEEAPRGWSVEPLGAVVDVLDRLRVPVNERERRTRLEASTRRFPYYGATGRVGEIDDFLLEGESVLLGEDGAPFLDVDRRKAYLVSGRYWVNNHAHILRARPPHSNAFLCHQLNAIRFDAFVSGTTRLKLTQSAMTTIPLRLPPPAEQRRIVSRIDELFSELDEGERALERVQTLVERYRDAVLRSAVTGELTKDWRELNPASSGKRTFQIFSDARAQAGRTTTPVAMADVEGLPQLPAGWAWTSLDAVADVVGGITVDRKRSGSGCEVVPYLRVANVQRGYLELGEVKTIAAPRDRIEQLRLRSGDILFNEGGDIDKLGRGWIWQAELPLCIHQNHVFRARLYTPGPWNKLISWFGNVLGRRLFMDMGKQTTNLASLSLSKLKSIPVPVMSEAEAAEIVSRVEDALSVVDKCLADLSAQRQRSASLRQSVLNAAFSGRLVPQDPTDEPASALLARLAAQAAETAPAPRRRARR